MQTLAQLRQGLLVGSRHLKLSEGLTEFPEEILTLKDTLEILDLSGNALTHLPASLAQCDKLRILFCSQNQFDHLPTVLGRCPALTMIGFKSNQIKTVLAQSLPPRLRWLILTDNQIGELPEALGQCRALQKLMLSGNQLTKLPDTLAQCSQLELLRVAENRLNVLPNWLWSHPSLTWLAYSGNPCNQAWMAQRLAQVQAKALAWRHFTLQEPLGEGASGVIYRALYQHDEGIEPLALKVFKGEMTSDGSPHSERLAMLLAGTHPHLIALKGVINDHPSRMAALAMELVPSIFTNLAGPPSFASCTRDEYQPNWRIEPADLLALVTAVAKVTAHLHQQGIMHGDLYGHNLLVSDWGQGGVKVLLGDFGAASLFDPSNAMWYRAHERLEVRAWGCLLEELLARCGEFTERATLIALAERSKSPDLSRRPTFAKLIAKLTALAPISSLPLFID